jgi:hypothetical protein
MLAANGPTLSAAHGKDDDRWVRSFGGMIIRRGAPKFSEKFLLQSHKTNPTWTAED